MSAQAGKNYALISTLLLCYPLTLMAVQHILIIDARSSGDLRTGTGTQWRLVTDQVMGGVSRGTLVTATIEAQPCLRMRGDVSLDNDGGFIQSALDLPDEIANKASAYTGLVLEVYGNGEQYNVHLRTADIWLPWQSYRATFTAAAKWQRIHLPFDEFAPYRIGTELNVDRIERVGLVAIGREFNADICIGRIGLYR